MNENANTSLEALEQRAASERAKLHRSVEDLKQLKTNAQDTVREKLDVKRQVRSHFWPVAATASFLALVFGYSLTGVFVD